MEAESEEGEGKPEEGLLLLSPDALSCFQYSLPELTPSSSL